MSIYTIPLYNLIEFLTPERRYNLRFVSKYFYINAWTSSELSYISCPYKYLPNRKSLCFSNGHVDCVKYFPENKINKYKQSIIIANKDIYLYYKSFLTVSFNEDFYINIIENSNINSLILLSDNINIIGRLSFYLDAIIRTSNIDFIKAIIVIIYDDNYEIFYNECSFEIIANDRDDIIMLLTDKLDIIGENRKYAIAASDCHANKIIEIMKTSVGNITPLRDNILYPFLIKI